MTDKPAKPKPPTETRENAERVLLDGTISRLVLLPWHILKGEWEDAKHCCEGILNNPNLPRNTLNVIKESKEQIERLTPKTLLDKVVWYARKPLITGVLGLGIASSGIFGGYSLYKPFQEARADKTTAAQRYAHITNLFSQGEFNGAYLHGKTLLGGIELLEVPNWMMSNITSLTTKALFHYKTESAAQAINNGDHWFSKGDSKCTEEQNGLQCAEVWFTKAAGILEGLGADKLEQLREVYKKRMRVYLEEGEIEKAKKDLRQTSEGSTSDFFTKFVLSYVQSEEKAWEGKTNRVKESPLGTPTLDYSHQQWQNEIGALLVNRYASSPSWKYTYGPKKDDAVVLDYENFALGKEVEEMAKEQIANGSRQRAEKIVNWFKGNVSSNSYPMAMLFAYLDALVEPKDGYYPGNFKHDEHYWGFSESVTMDPSGRYVAYVVRAKINKVNKKPMPNNFCEVVLFDATTGKKFEVEKTDCYTKPSFTYDGKSIAVDDGKATLKFYDLEKLVSGVKESSTEGTLIDRGMSQDGRYLTSLRSGLGIYLEDTIQSNNVRISSPASTWNNLPYLTSDGTKVFFETRIGNDPHREIIMYCVKDGSLVNITQTPDIDEAMPSANHDGSKVVFLQYDRLGQGFKKSRVVIATPPKVKDL